MFNTINCFRFAILTASFIFGRCCPSEQYRKFQENVLCENGEPLVFYPSDAEVGKATLDEFSKSGVDWGMVIEYCPDEDPKSNLLGRYQSRVIKTDLKPLTGKQVNVTPVYVEFTIIIKP
jgi:hypothetical protein